MAERKGLIELGWFGEMPPADPWISIRFAWYDLWIGAYWDRNARVLYVCPLPCVVVVIRAWWCSGIARSAERREDSYPKESGVRLDRWGG